MASSRTIRAKYQENLKLGWRQSLVIRHPSRNKILVVLAKNDVNQISKFFAFVQFRFISFTFFHFFPRFSVVNSNFCTVVPFADDTKQKPINTIKS